MITSRSNSHVKHVVQLNTRARVRREEGLFVAEGVKMFLEAPPEWISRVYVSEELPEEIAGKCRSAGIPCERVAADVFRKMSDTMTPQGVLTVLRQPVRRLEELLAGKAPLLAVLEDVQDPGNLGTILRTAEGAGADGVILSRGCADLFNPKTVRSTMGSIYRMPCLYADDMPALMERLKQAQVCTWAAHLDGRKNYDEEDYSGGTAFLIGNEGKGLSPELTAMAEGLLRIPMAGQVESLNAAMACGLLLYEAARQRRKK